MNTEEAALVFTGRLLLYGYVIYVYPLPREEPDRSDERPRVTLLLLSLLLLFETLGRVDRDEDTALLRLGALRCSRDMEGLPFSRDDREDTVCTRAAGWLRSRAWGCTRSRA